MTDIVITFADGETMSFAPGDDNTVLVAAEKAGNALAHNCREGTCRTCVGRDENGAEVFLCTAPARPGFRVTVPYRRADVTPPTLRRAKINSFARVSASVWELRYRLQFPLAFLPGQYVEASFPGLDAARRFSMASTPADKEQVLHIRDIPGGGMSTYLGARARPEDAFTVRGPFGVFYLRATPKPKLFVAGGTGLAPILSMLRGIDRAAMTPLALVAGFATAEDAYGLDELAKLADDLPLETVFAAAAKTDGAWSGIAGTPVDALEAIRSVQPGAGIEAYLCGPPGMVDAARKALCASGVAAQDIFNEEFVHAASAA